MAHIQINLSRALDDLSNAYEGSAFWTSTEATYALNEALRMWNLLTSMWNKREVVPTRFKQYYYNLPQALVYGAKVEWNGIPLRRTSLAEMDYGHPAWENEHIDSGGNVPTRPVIWLPVGVTRFAIWPADTDDDNSLTIDGVNRTPILITGTDYMDIGQEEYDAVLAYATHYLAFKGDKMKWKATTSLYKRFIQAAAKKNKRLYNASMFRRYLFDDKEQTINSTTTL